MENEKKTAAEIAREERKARMEKTSQNQEKKKEKKENQSPTKKKLKIIIPIVVVVLALAIGLCFFFGVPQRTFKTVKISNGTDISQAEYQYYYMQVYNNYMQTAYQYEQYYSAYYGEGVGVMMTGFDYTKTPANQAYTPSEEDKEAFTKKYGENPTWADFIEETSVNACKEISLINKEAEKAGFKLSEDGKTEINEYIESLRKEAADNNYSLNAFLKENYGRGMNESLLRSILIKQQTYTEYLEQKQTDISDAITNDQITDAYNKNPNEYNNVSLRYFTISTTAATNTDETKYTDEELKEQTKKNNEANKVKADDFLSKATVSNFTELTAQYADKDKVSYYKDNDTYSSLKDANASTLEQYFNEDAVKWAYAKDRAVGDKTVVSITTDSGAVSYNILLITSLPTRDDTKQPVSVRHILFATEKTTTDDDGNQKTEKIRTLEEAKKLAEDTLAAWVKNGAKEDAFIELANTKSDDPGSSDNGGLYEDITKTSSYVKPFLDWCFADGRKVGDYGIIETEYGYHIMYMSAISDTTSWQAEIKETLTETNFNEYYDNVTSDDVATVSVSSFFSKRVRNTVEDYAERVIKNMTASTTTKSTTNATTTAATTAAAK